MFRKTIVFGSPLLVVAALSLTPPAVQAAPPRGGGFHGGGFHSGGFHGGGFHSGGFHGGFHSGFHAGGFHHGGFHVGSRPFFHHFGSFRTFGYYPYALGYYPYSLGYSPYTSGYYPYSSMYYPYSDDYLSDSYATEPYDDSYLGSGSTYNPSYSSSSYQPPQQDNLTANVTVTLPADAELWFNGTKLNSTGTVREFRTPPLALGHKYTYDIRARWNEDGHPVTQTQEVTVTPGGLVRLEFPIPSGTAGEASKK